ncbi:hypothetical protein [Marinobacter sp. X15-166B]|uniref:hypothetical protein n=1 Tax=Marinobacter sp. X15-166B TaxID=1897620 RepID=UPI00085C477D|nr:hypothetical protein [Marinobacter sp. X15-166B]OEY67440.1 hypothetical protein BG841_14035 [Marinobacter sp. X15-166B]
MEAQALTSTAPAALLHDIGELTVINDDNGRCHHKVAMVLVFNSNEEAAACMEAGLVRLIPSHDLSPEATEYLNRG